MPDRRTLGQPRSPVDAGKRHSRHLASLLKKQNSQLKVGLRQQDESRRMLERELRRVQQRVEMLDKKRADEAVAYKKIIAALTKT